MSLRLLPLLLFVACSPRSLEDAGVEPEPDAGEVEDAGLEAGTLDVLLRDGGLDVTERSRPTFGVMSVTQRGDWVFAIEARRHIEPGPLNLSWRSQFRLAAYEGGVERWAWTAEKDELISDVVAHPSGEVTIALQRHQPARDAYELLRFSATGAQLDGAPLPQPQTLPATDFAADDPRPLFRMKGQLTDAFTGAWIRLLPEGEGVVVAYLSYVDAPPTDPRSTRFALGLSSLSWDGAAWAERWSRVVEGSHAAEPVAWTYDEFRWRQQAIHPFLARDEVTGELLVGRAWNSTRCRINVEVFAEFTNADCVLRAADPLENERLPFAVTRFTATGQRLGTIVVPPADDAAEQVAFSFAAQGGKLALAGAVVRKLPDGSKRAYPASATFVDYDGFISVFDAQGQLLHDRDFDFGRADLLSSLRWTSGGLLAGGSSGWDRWQGGMSVSRGSSPIFAWLSEDGLTWESRLIALGDQQRHWSLHAVQLEADGAIAGYGVSDAPMTHSADSDPTQRTFGALRVRLR